ncbi:YeiH family protein [Campylobacter sp.]|uniref:YeiH family protein n=1 Tax=Campylobacter sp. TaxID=205 RepID=UPI0026FF1EB2|nr:YeiH family protein [Campylobacter sp.]
MDQNKIKAVFLLLALAISAYFLSNLDFIKAFELSPLIVSIILGMIIGNGFKSAVALLKDSGVLAIATKQILRLGIILFGFRLTLQDIYAVGFFGVLIAFIIVFSTFFLGIFIGQKLGLDSKSSTLISSGASICGAAAVLATQSVIKADSDRVAVAVSTVVLFGTIGMFVYPIVFRSEILGFDSASMGLFTGATLHEVAHVIGAAAGIGENAGAGAVIMKMLRVLMLVPFLLMLGLFAFKQSADKSSSIKKFVPYFALWFLVAVCVGSLPIFPRQILPTINFIDIILLCIAMGALGTTIRKDVLLNAGKKPFILAFLLFVWLFTVGFLMVKFWL